MFTGIVEEVGTVTAVKSAGNTYSLEIKGKKVIEGTSVGDSISTNGVCLTVTAIAGDRFHTDVMAETLRMSTLGQLKKGSKVNLERALTADTRLGGHIVSGHIDGIGTIESLRNEGNAVWMTISAKEDLMKYMIRKGSVAVEGISLTIAKLNNSSFAVSLIPHTAKETTLLHKKAGDQVNLECDVIGKYVERLLGFNNKKEITVDFLKENGFA